VSGTASTGTRGSTGVDSERAERGESTERAERRDRGLAIALALAIAAGAVVLYWPIRTHEWLIWDDFIYVSRNPHVIGGLSAESVRWAFSNFYLANWFPGTWMSWMLDFDLHGDEAGAFLTTNLVLHAANSALLFLALRRLTHATWRSAFAAAVFAVHPLHVESVAWVAARKDVLSGLFWMLALWLHGGDGPATRRRIGVALCFAVGFGCKPTLITLPFVLLLLDDWPLRRFVPSDTWSGWDRARLGAAVRDKAALFALLAVFAVVMFVAQQSGGTVQNLESLPLGMRLKNAAASYVAYIAATFWPSGLSFFYPHPGDSLSWPVAAGCFALLCAITAATTVARNHRHFAVGWLWFVGTLFPTIGLVQIGAQARADRYMYLPLVGLTIMVAWAIPKAVSRRRPVRVALAIVGCSAVAALSIRTSLQIPVWQDSVALAEHGLEVTENNHVAHSLLGNAYRAQGRGREAVEQYEAALRITPDYTSVANNLAWLLATDESLENRDLGRAVQLAEMAAALSRSTDPEILDTLAVCYAAAGRFDDAIETSLRGIALAEQGDDPSLGIEMRSRLESYRAGTRYHAPKPAR